MANKHPKGLIFVLMKNEYESIASYWRYDIHVSPSVEDAQRQIRIHSPSGMSAIQSTALD